MTTYRVLLANSTNFTRMRFYLLVSSALSLILPLIIIPVEWAGKLAPLDSFPGVLLIQTKQTALTAANSNSNLIQADSGMSIFNLILFTAYVVYVIGIIYRCYLFVKNLIEINGLIKKSSKVKQGNYWIVNLKSELPAFSFFNYIFINTTYKNLSSIELAIIKKHELVHVKQYHTLDILFVELVGILFWFNPLINYLKRTLKEIHEYIVDERIAGYGEKKKAYARLLLTLASDTTRGFDLTASFAGDHIKRRISTLAKPRTSSKYKLMYVILVPLAAMLLLSFSYLKTPRANSKTQNDVAGAQLKLKKYCGVYSPSKKDNGLLKPLEILIKDNKLFLEADPKSTNRRVELHFESDSVFSYIDNSNRRILFFLDRKKEIAGCALVRLLTKVTGNKQSNYLLLEGGEYSKRK